MAEATPAEVEEPISEAATRAGSAVLLGIMAAVFMVAAEARVIAPVLPALASEFETSVARAGVLITAYTIPYGLFQLVYGPLADRFSRQRVIGVALGLFALGTFVSGFAPSMLVLDLLRVFTGAAGAGVIPVALAYVGDAVPYVERQAALGRVVSIASLGGVLSATLGGVVATFLDWRAIFIVYGILALLVSGAMLRLPVHRARAGAARSKGIIGPYRAVFERAGRRAAALYLLVFVEGFVATSTFGYLGAFLFERDGLSYAAIGGLLTISGVASMLTGRIVGRLVRWVEERGMLVAGGTMLVVAYGLMGLRPMLLFFPIAMVLAGSGFVIAHSTLQARATELVPELRGTTVALFAFALFIGGGLGTYVAGLAIEGFGYEATIYGTAALLALFTALSWPLLHVIHGARER